MKHKPLSLECCLRTTCSVKNFFLPLHLEILWVNRYRLPGNQEWGTSGVSVRATSILVCQRPSKCNQCDNAVFRRWRQGGLTMLTKRPFTGLPLKFLELVGKLGPPYQSHQMHLHRYWTGSSTSIIPCHWNPSDSIQVANVFKDLGVVMDNSFSSSIRRSFAELSVHF